MALMTFFVVVVLITLKMLVWLFSLQEIAALQVVAEGEFKTGLGFSRDNFMTVQCARLCRAAGSEIDGMSMRLSESRCFGPTGPARW